MAAINLRERDGLHGRLFDVTCPVMWLHVSRISESLFFAVLEGLTESRIQGTDDAVYSVDNAKQEIKLFKNAPAADLVVVDGGQHFLSASHPKDVDNALVDFVGKWHK